MPALATTAIRWGLIALVGAGIVIGIYFYGHSEGVDKERARILAEIEKARKDRDRVESDTRRLPDDDLFDKLLKPPR